MQSRPRVHYETQESNIVDSIRSDSRQRGPAKPSSLGPAAGAALEEPVNAALTRLHRFEEQSV